MQASSSTTVAVYHYFLDERERLVPFGNVNDNFDNDRLENVYFHYVPRRLKPLRERTLRRYNPETMTRGMHVLYEMFPLCAPCPFRLLSCSSVASSPTRGNLVTGSPHLSSCSACSRHLHLLHRSLNELPEPICCRCIIFGSLPWHPFFPPR